MKSSWQISEQNYAWQNYSKIVHKLALNFKKEHLARVHWHGYSLVWGTNCVLDHKESNLSDRQISRQWGLADGRRSQLIL